MTLELFIKTFLPAIEEELSRAVAQASTNSLLEASTQEMEAMLTYHMGWTGEGAGAEATGKRIRPLLVLLSASAAGGFWEHALPAAAAVELIHNFSLIHDDIQDNSPLRRGRPTLWKIWGIPQAINAGDAMFTLAHLELLRLEETVSVEVALQAAHILQAACLRLTQGQYLDIAYEARGDLTLNAYWPMVAGKTSALLGACTELGALAAGKSDQTRVEYRQFGVSLGLAFQAQDDLLGIWGDAEITGKSAESDLLTGKKSLPVLYGLSKNGTFARRWAQGSIRPPEVPQLAKQLELEGAREFTEEWARYYTVQALDSLEQAIPQPEGGQALVELSHRLLNRQG